MAKQERNWIRYGGGALVGISLSIASHHVGVDDKITRLFPPFTTASKGLAGDNPSVRIVEKPPVINLPLQEPPINQEILKALQDNLTWINVGILPGFERYKFKFAGGGCSGFIMRNWKNEPYVFTAQHCVPVSVLSESDKKIYRSESEGGTIFNIKILSGSGSEFTSRKIRYHANQIPADLAVLAPERPEQVKQKGLPINLGSAEKWEIFYRISRAETGDVSVSPMRLLDHPESHKLLFIDLGDSALSCKPGMSGSPIVNSVGEVMGLLTDSMRLTVTSDMVERFQLDPKHIGREIQGCGAVDAGTIKEMLP